MRIGAAYPQRSDSPSKRVFVFLRVHLFKAQRGWAQEGGTRIGGFRCPTFGLLELNMRGICPAQGGAVEGVKIAVFAQIV